MNCILAPRALHDLRNYVYHVAAVTDPRAAIRERVRVEAALGEFMAAPIDGVEAKIRGWPRRLRKHFIHPFHAYYERRPDGLYVVRLYHHARRPIER